MRTSAARVARFGAAGKRFHMLAESGLVRAPLPALGVHARTVGDFFRGRSVHRVGGGPAFRERFSMEMGGCCALIG